jgi:UDP-N-acetylglucosamine acyltransferase
LVRASSTAVEGGVRIHPTAVVDPNATLGRDVQIGPYCVVDGQVSLGDGVLLDSHVRISGQTAVGAGSMIGAFATLGAAPFDLKYAGEPSFLVIGERCRIAEYAHLSTGTAAGGGLTSIGDDCLIMSHCHVAHDCVLGDSVLLASSSALAGHVHVGDGARISGCSCVHQKVSIGRAAFVGGGSVLAHDLIPYGLAVGNRARLLSLNLRGLRRQRVPPAELRAMLSAFRYVFDLPSTDGAFLPLSLPRAPELRARAEQLEAHELPRVSEIARFVLGRRAVWPKAHPAAPAPSVNLEASVKLPICLP